MSLLDKEDIIDDKANEELLIQYLTNNGWFKVHISNVSLEGVFYEKKFLTHVVKLRIYHNWRYDRYREEYSLEIQNYSTYFVYGLDAYRVVNYSIPVESEKIWDVLKNLDNILQELH